ncbi:Os03g0598001 [Oryza sativa Japonica Group]|uniref:Os03g0598001 protein n=1 Tax=Oryza sativa subsp. japonica TaxID=39947 RepID=A0A0P0VZZ3_ORYSJ|nr:Os03g0598001 [Oryza sativa Japonica Group]
MVGDAVSSDELPAWHGCGRRRMQPPTMSSGAWLWTAEDAASSDELRRGRRRRAPGVAWLWMAEDAASGNELRRDAMHGQRRTWPLATSPAWRMAAEDATTSNKPGVGVVAKDVAPATTSDVGRGQQRTQPPATTFDVRRG